jgi:tRNA(fMet)-specific endonuclease VapC
VWILDTDSLTLFLQGHPTITDNLAAKTPGEVVITVVTAEEQIWGRLSAIRRASQASGTERLVRTYRKFHEALNDLLRFVILDFTEVANLQYQELRRQKIRVGTQDLRIAAIALSVDAIIVTRNQRDFRQVPALQLEDWTIEN